MKPGKGQKKERQEEPSKAIASGIFIRFENTLNIFSSIFSFVFGYRQGKLSGC